jgi:hypothetical protein
MMDKNAIQQLAEDIYDHYPDFGNGERALMEKSDVLAALCEMFEAGVAAASPQLRWVKASERKPKEEGLYFVRKSIYGGLGYTKYTARFEEEDFYDDHYNDRSLPFYVEGLEWLEEAPAPQAIPETNIEEAIKGLIMHRLHKYATKYGWELLVQQSIEFSDDLYDMLSKLYNITVVASLRGKEEGERGASPNKEEDDFHEGMWGMDVASDNNSNGTAVASHTASSGNSNQQ